MNENEQEIMKLELENKMKLKRLCMKTILGHYFNKKLNGKISVSNELDNGEQNIQTIRFK